MIPADEELFELLLDECDLLNDAQLRQRARALLPKWASFYAAKRGQEVRYWYLRRALLMFMQSAARKWVDFAVDRDRVSAHQVWTATTRMLEETRKELDVVDPQRTAPRISVSNVTSDLPDSFAEAVEWLTTGWALSVPVEVAG